MALVLTSGPSLEALLRSAGGVAVVPPIRALLGTMSDDAPTDSAER